MRGAGPSDRSAPDGSSFSSLGFPMHSDEWILVFSQIERQRSPPLLPDCKTKKQTFPGPTEVPFHNFILLSVAPSIPIVKG